MKAGVLLPHVRCFGVVCFFSLPATGASLQVSWRLTAHNERRRGGSHLSTHGRVSAHTFPSAHTHARTHMNTHAVLPEELLPITACILHLMHLERRGGAAVLKQQEATSGGGVFYGADREKGFAPPKPDLYCCSGSLTFDPRVST